jgi:septum formation protein
VENLSVMLTLASQSATRRALLEGAGLKIATAPAPVDERALEAEAQASGADPVDVALVLAKAKALAVSNQRPGTLVIGADQTLSLGLERFHKPVDLAAAREQLTRLRGKTHRLHAAVAIARFGELLWADVHSAELTLRDFSDAERDAVLAQEGEAVLGSVGGYRLEGPSIRLFASVSGDYFTILGLPLLPLLAALREIAPEELDGAVSA